MTIRKQKLRIQASKNTNSKHNVNVESLFRETTRNGRHTIRLVYLGLTPNILIIASTHSFGTSTPKSTQDSNVLEMRTLHPLDTINISIFKKSQRHTLKISFHNNNNPNRYFELEKSRGTENLWATWCKSVIQRRQKNKSLKDCLECPLVKSTSYDLSIFNKQWESQRFIWNDKYLYLGSKREIEDSSRPKPVPGLGPAEDIKLLYLKPQYFGCWDQSEHWVQCESSKLLK